MPAVLADRPSLGAPPQGAKARALLGATVACGGLFAGALALTLAAPPRLAPQRTVAMVLDAYDAAPAPPPLPAGPAGGAPKLETAAPRTQTPVPERVPEQVRAAEATLLAPIPVPAGNPAREAAGQPGGVPGCQAGGVAGGQSGGTVGGQVGGLVAPRFDAVYLQNPEPEYPVLSKRLGEEGKVILRVLVSAEGLPEQVEIRQTSGHARLDQAALGTVRRWRFTPARRGSERLAAWVLVPLSFQLEA